MKTRRKIGTNGDSYYSIIVLKTMKN